MDPLLSICCITYNHVQFIRDTLESFVKQKTKYPLEIIVHDDNSTDGTTEIIKEFKNNFPDLFYPIFQKENQHSKGIKPIPNFVFPMARGKYIALCEGDDYWTDPYKLQKQVDILEKPGNKKIIAVVTNASTVDSKGNIIMSEFLVIPPSNNEGVYDLYDFFKQKHRYPTLTAVFRADYSDWIIREMQRMANPFLGDWILWVLLHLKGNFYFLNEVTGAYRMNPNSMTHKADAVKRWEADFIIRQQLLETLPAEYHKYIKNNWHTYFKLSLAYRKRKDIARFIKFQILSLLVHPINYIHSIISIIFTRPGH